MRLVNNGLCIEFKSSIEFMLISMIKALYYLLVTFMVLCGCSHIGFLIDYGTVSEKSPVVKLAVNDLKSCLSKSSSVNVGAFQLLLDSTLVNGEFGYKVNESSSVIFRAGDEIGIAHAIYTYLEKLGYTFDITGISTPSSFDKSLSEPVDTLVRPFIRWRGVRQHVNFPMDISSYNIEDAEEYINQLVRLRFNKLVVHSYPGQWYETLVDDSLVLAGNYFYGNKHYMYDNVFLQKKISSNDSLFCIPEAEKLRHNPKANSQFAVLWMKRLIAYAKSMGLYVQYSFEPRIATVDQVVSTAHDILNTYPEIDALEMITEETGGWGRRCTRKETITTLNKYFDAGITSDSIVVAPIRESQSDLNDLYTQIGIISHAIKRMQGEKESYPELKLGIYCSITPYAEGAYRLARLALPETHICLMASHGSEGTFKALPSIVRTGEDLEMTEIYSWIEFDGLMYLYQNSISGNEKIMRWLTGFDGNKTSSILFNHWRTAESRTSARFVAEATIDARLSSSSFYDSYSARLAVPSKSEYSKAMQLLNQVDTFATKNLGNIGFCWMGAWRNGGSYTWMQKDNIEYARNLYFEAGNILADIVRKADKESAAYDYLSFICNRVLCSVLYLDAFDEAVNIQKVMGKDNCQSDESKVFVRSVCDKALLIFDQYMEKHAEMLLDRGCEGTLVSVWNAPIRGLKIYREKLGGIPVDGPSSLDAVDAPPLPIVY